MSKSNQDLIRLLQREWVFLETGGYTTSPRTPWRLPMIFEESPSCPKVNVTRSHSCNSCALMRLVPLRHHGAAVPCRHIPFNTVGETLETLHRWGTLEDLKLGFRHWLIETITRLQIEEARVQLLKQRDLYQGASLT